MLWEDNSKKESFGFVSETWEEGMDIETYLLVSIVHMVIIDCR